jgi:hypothetical protein
MPDTRRLLELALKGLTAERERIDEEITQLKTQLRGDDARVGAVLARPKRTMSAAARRRISLGMKRRYAALRQAVQPNAVRPAPARAAKPAGGGLTAAGRKRLSDLMKKRWAQKRRAATK